MGEYTGLVVDHTVTGPFVASIEDEREVVITDSTLNIGIDAGRCGNEIRYINSYLGVACNPNVCMRTSFVNTYPHIVIVCLRDIAAGDELLLDYGEAYNNAYLRNMSLLSSTTSSVIEVDGMDATSKCADKVKDTVPNIN